jgi:serine/threonine-protein kinase
MSLLSTTLLIPLLVPMAEPENLPLAAYRILEQHCFKCHHVLQKQSLDLANGPATLADSRGIIVAGKPDESELFKRMIDKDESIVMPPPEEKNPVSPEELETIRKWIESGAKYPDPSEVLSKRPHISRDEMIRRIHKHLFDTTKIPATDRRDYRYISLVHLWNNPQYTEDDLRMVRAAVSKTLNSLSTRPRIVAPTLVDEEGSILAFRLSDYGWDEGNKWKILLSFYPYGIRYDKVREEEIRTLAADIYQATGTKNPSVWADWFVAIATQPGDPNNAADAGPYHLLLDLPLTQKEVEDSLGVNRLDDYRKDRLMRAGFLKSGVSKQNRSADRHDARYGAYWASMDFKAGDPQSSLLRFPLGPRNMESTYTEQSFNHAGGELIWNLPNGLQAYLLVDGDGNRINAGPVEIVNDDKNLLGTRQIVTGLSCMHCHKVGMIPFKDEVRSAHGVGGDARAKVDKIYPKQEDFDKRVQEDIDRFLKALEPAIGPFLRVGPLEKVKTEDFPEPIGAVAKRYLLEDPNLLTVAADLGLEDGKELTTLIKHGGDRLRKLGLGTLPTGGVIKRENWQGDGKGVSLYQRLAVELDFGSIHDGD